MSATTASASPPELRWISLSEIHPNAHNVNKMTAWQYAKVLESLSEYGWVSPLIVRTATQGYELVDGEHRWQGARDLGMDPAPCFLVDGYSDAQVKKISLILNELKGQADPLALGAQLKELAVELGPDLMTAMPYTEEIVRSFVDLPALPVLSAPPGTEPKQSPEERWVERTFRMPSSVAEVLDEALAKASDEIRRHGSNPEKFQAIEVISAEYLAK